MHTQREWDIAQLDAQLKIQGVVEEWMRGFLGSRASAPPQSAPEIDGGLPGGGLEEQLPITEDTIDTSGGGY